MASVDESTSIVRAVRAVALDIIQTTPTERLRGAVDYQESVDVGSGTVQRAFSIIERAGAAITRARGHRGRFVVSRDLGKLWLLAELPPVRAVLTPPGAAEVYGMAAGLTAEFERFSLPLRIEYRRGAAARLAEARRDMTLAVVSRGAARASGGSTDRFQTRTMSPGSYYGQDSIVVLRPSALNPNAAPGSFRIALDRDSDDHIRLTKAQFPEPGHDFVNCPFPQVPAEILRGNVEVGVWHRMLLLIPPTVVGLVEDALTPVAGKLATELGPATIVFAADNLALQAVVDTLSFPNIARKQRKLIRRMTNEAAVDNIWYR